MAPNTTFTPTKEGSGDDMYEKHHTRERPPQLNTAILPTATGSTPKTESSVSEDLRNDRTHGVDNGTPVQGQSSLEPNVTDNNTPTLDVPLFPDNLDRAYVYFYGTADVLNTRPSLTDFALQAHDDCNANYGHSFNYHGWQWGLPGPVPQGRSESLLISGRTRTHVTEATNPPWNNVTPITPGTGDGDVCYTGGGFDDSIIPLGTQLDERDLYDS